MKNVEVQNAGLPQENANGGSKNGGGGGVGQNFMRRPPQKKVSDPPHLGTCCPPPSNSISLIKSLRNSQNFSQVTSSETAFGGSPKWLPMDHPREVCLFGTFPPPPPFALPSGPKEPITSVLEMTRILNFDLDLLKVYDCMHCKSRGHTS